MERVDGEVDGSAGNLILKGSSSPLFFDTQINIFDTQNIFSPKGDYEQIFLTHI